jgi:hypothetical protein
VSQCEDFTLGKLASYRSDSCSKILFSSGVSAKNCCYFSGDFGIFSCIMVVVYLCCSWVFRLRIVMEDAEPSIYTEPCSVYNWWVFLLSRNFSLLPFLGLCLFKACFSIYWYAMQYVDTKWFNFCLEVCIYCNRRATSTWFCWIINQYFEIFLLKTDYFWIFLKIL